MDVIAVILIIIMFTLSCICFFGVFYMWYQWTNEKDKSQKKQLIVRLIILLFSGIVMFVGTLLIFDIAAQHKTKSSGNNVSQIYAE